MKPYAIEVRGLKKTFGQLPVLDQLDLLVNHGEVYGLLGANGAGKSTAMRLVCGLLRADAGTGYCLDYPLGNPIPELGYMPQRGNLYDDLTIVENLRFFASAHALDFANDRVDELLMIHELTGRAHQRVSNLSGGWRQRVAFAAALLHSPRLLLLDEPSAGLDPQAREHLWQAIRQLSDHDKVTVLVTTHYTEEASRCDRIGYLSDGHLAAEGAAHQLANDIGLTTWHIALPHPSSLISQPEAIQDDLASAKMSMIRTSDGWRITGRMGMLLPAALTHWCEHSHVQILPVTATLADALAWLACENKTNQGLNRPC